MVMERTERLISDVLGEDSLSLRIDRYQIVETLNESSPCFITIYLTDQKQAAHVIEGSGVGLLDAAYNGLMDHYARTFNSLETIKFTEFGVTGKMETSAKQGADAVAEVSLVVHNSSERKFTFTDSGRSIIAATLSVVIAATEHFVNSERAFITVYRALCDARERGRPDLINAYTHQLAELVTTTSYTAVIEQIKAEISSSIG